jgi:hypothetical protein
MVSAVRPITVVAATYPEQRESKRDILVEGDCQAVSQIRCN